MIDKTLSKGLKLLEALADSDTPRGVTNIASELELSKSNAHRLLQTLAALGYVDSVEGKYFATPKIWSLGEKIVGRLAVRAVALPEMESLALETQETVHLSILDKTEVIYLEKIDSPQPIRAYTEVGGRAPASAVATGKAMLAYQDDDIIAAAAARLAPHTRLSLPDGDALRKELAGVLKLGYAINRGEWRERIGGLAAPVFNRYGKAIAAIGISGPTDRLTPKRMRDHAQRVCEAARRVSEKLGSSA
ncbi:IclR family transcriptional regulator [Pigmentiphaga sp.]|uniref:IclR family transcriptional regulator n=1 Tax=Pigmentiphaga sp. TaxID=1977564 RepID=UPI00128D7478|nr:IclR family transcriptional regulator [Pigmentiphaga sp.]MPS25685.1 IclR family transcriptional regulator [Alcaligenaceae bacterium SAGV5]MPS54497.1 IclR family transcriptional regulator [Alcaligenaceae bacterium SAGV3]MPT58637.1 IclR family transcriptional regulator [Alcaligenaceae bacterium]